MAPGAAIIQINPSKEKNQPSCKPVKITKLMFKELHDVMTPGTLEIDFLYYHHIGWLITFSEWYLHASSNQPKALS